MESILKALVSSRQQGSSAQGADPVTSLVGSLLGGGSSGGVNLSDGVDMGDVAGLVGGFLNATQNQPSASQQPAGGLGGMMGALESIMGGGGQGGAGDPVMLLLQPFIAPLAKKANISPEVATVVVSFVAHQLLAHHPTSGRDSTAFNFESMLQQIGSGSIDPNLLKSSGMVGELSKRTGLDEATATQSLNMAFMLVGKGAASLIHKSASAPASAASAASKVVASKLGASGSAKAVNKKK
jgi:hypothetical protein